VRRVLGVVVTAFVVAFSSAGPASASTSIDWKANFPEQFGGPNSSPFICAPGVSSCGSGEVIGLGQVQDTIVFGGGCGGACDVRTLTFADGSTIVMDETDSNPQIPGNSGAQPLNAYGSPIRIDLSETIVGGTGRFAGASGTASGQVKIAGGTAIINLSGTVTF
jgi:hypothetical protein